MALSVTTTGNGTLGHIEPGWSEQEFSTPASPAERAGGTGTVSFGAQDVSEGVLVIENDITSTDDALGSVSGIVRQVSWAGNRIGITHDNKLARYNATRNIPPMIAASMPGCLDLAEQVLEPRLTGLGGALWSLAGHAAGFDTEGNLVNQSVYTGVYNFTVDGTTYTLSDTGYFDTAQPVGDFVSLDGKIYSTETLGSSFVPWPAYSTTFTSLVNSVAMKTMLDGGDLVFSLEGGPPNGPSQAPEYAYGQAITLTVDYSADTITLLVDYSQSSDGSRTSTSDTASIAGLDRDAELALFVEMTYDGAGDYTTQVTICNTSDYSTTVNVSATYDVYFRGFDRWFSPWYVTGNIRSVWQWNANGAFMPIAEYETQPPFSVVGTVAFGEPAIGYSGAVWDWLQDFCTAYRWEIGLSGDEVTARRMGTMTLDVSNYEGTPSVTPTTTRTGRKIEVTYSNARAVFVRDSLNSDIIDGGLVYDALEDDNRILSVGAGETLVTALQTNAYLTSVLPPTRTTTYPNPNGTYYVIDSTGLPIVANQWEDYGGRLEVALDPDTAGVINVTIYGPSEIPSTTGPYSIAVSDGSNQYAALSILGTGIVADPVVKRIRTGADATKTPVEVGTSITNNAFISTREQAYDVGLWAGVDVSGPRISLDITVPNSALSGFGLTAGSIINWRDNSYRVDSANVGGLKTTIQASRFLTVGMFDDAWDGETVGDHDSVWDGYQAIDQRILSYKGTPEAQLPGPIFPP